MGPAAEGGFDPHPRHQFFSLSLGRRLRGVSFPSSGARVPNLVQRPAASPPTLPELRAALLAELLLADGSPTRPTVCAGQQALLWL